MQWVRDRNEFLLLLHYLVLLCWVSSASTSLSNRRRLRTYPLYPPCALCAVPLTSHDPAHGNTSAGCVCHCPSTVVVYHLNDHDGTISESWEGARYWGCCYCGVESRRDGGRGRPDQYGRDPCGEIHLTNASVPCHCFTRGGRPYKRTSIGGKSESCRPCYLAEVTAIPFPAQLSVTGL